MNLFNRKNKKALTKEELLEAIKIEGNVITIEGINLEKYSINIKEDIQSLKTLNILGDNKQGSIGGSNKQGNIYGSNYQGNIKWSNEQGNIGSDNKQRNIRGSNEQGNIDGDYNRQGIIQCYKWSGQRAFNLPEEVYTHSLNWEASNQTVEKNKKEQDEK